MSEVALAKDPSLISYMALRRATGLVAMLLPFALACVNMALVSRIMLEGSISAYYYTGVRDVLVGGLCAIGLFLFMYYGYDEWDSRLTNLAGLFAVVVAFCPTTPAHPSTTARAVGYVHLTCAALLFSVLAVIALWLFRKTGPAGRTRQKKRRDVVYLVCGIVIVLCIVLVPIESFVLGASIARFHPLFWLETTAIIAFGVAWLVKGQAILKDPAGPAMLAA
jgi:uncharacterized membrane protein